MFNIVSLTDKLWLSFPLKSGGDVTLKHTSSHSYISDFHSPACFTPPLGCRISILNSPVMHAKSFQSCLILCDPMDCSLPCSSLYGIFQAGTLESVAISSSRGSSRPRDRTQVFCVSCFNTSTAWEAQTHQGPTINKTKIQSTDQEKNFCQRCNRQGLNFQNIQTAHTAWYQKQTNNSRKKKWAGDFPGGSVTKTPCSQGRGLGFNPWSGNYASTKCSEAKTKDPMYHNKNQPVQPNK